MLRSYFEDKGFAGLLFRIQIDFGVCIYGYTPNQEPNYQINVANLNSTKLWSRDSMETTATLSLADQNYVYHRLAILTRLIGFIAGNNCIDFDTW